MERQLFLYLLPCFVGHGVTSLNLTIMIYGAWPSALLQSIPSLGPGWDTAITQVRQQYADVLNVTRVFVSSRNVRECPDTGPYYPDVVDYYYKYRADQPSDEITVLFYAGCDGDPTFALLAAEWDIFVASLIMLCENPSRIRKGARVILRLMCETIPNRYLSRFASPLSGDQPPSKTFSDHSGTSFSNFRNRSLYPTTINAGAVQYDLYGTAIVSLCNTYNWTNVCFIYQLASVYPFGINVYKSVLPYVKKHAPHINLILITLQNDPDPKQVNYNPIFDRVTQSCRVVLVSMAPWFTREVMMQAYQRNLTNGSDYAWFTVDLNENSLGPVIWKLDKPDDEIARDAFVGLFQIIGCWKPKSPEMTVLKQRWKKEAETNYNATWPGVMGPNQYSETAFGLVHVIAQAIKNGSARGLDISRGHLLAQSISGTSSVVPTMSELIRIDDMGEMNTRVCIDNFDHDSGRFEGALYVDLLHQPVQSFPNKSLIWRTYDKLPPRNMPVCGYSGREPLCQRRNLPEIVGSVAAAVVLAVLGGFSLWWIRSSADADNSWWKIDSSELTERQEPVNGKSNQPSGLCTFKGNLVWTKTVSRQQRMFPNKEASELLRKMRRINHMNVVRLVGVVASEPSVRFVMEYCKRGCLGDVIGEVRRDAELRAFMIMDLVEGLHAIHHSALKYHGNLKPSTCLIDNRFTLKISHPGISRLVSTFATVSDAEVEIGLENCKTVPPELVKAKEGNDVQAASQASDIFALASILDSLFPGGSAAEFSSSVVLQVKASIHPRDSQALHAMVFAQVLELISRARSRNPGDRPNIVELRKAVRNNFCRAGSSMVDSLLNRVTKNAELLEDAVAQRTTDLKNEMALCDNLLREILPKSIVHDMRINKSVTPESYDSATIMFTYVIGFGEFVAEHEKSSLAVIDFLNQMFVAFDHVLAEHDTYKVETINDSYMVASGLPERNGDRHGAEVCLVAIGFLQTFIKCWSSLPLRIKFGINTDGSKLSSAVPYCRLRKRRFSDHTGPCVTGVVGKKRPRYCLFGDTINTASRMASHGEAWKIHISALTNEIVKTVLGTEFRGKIQLKGKGEVETFWLSNHTTMEPLTPLAAIPPSPQFLPRTEKQKSLEPWRHIAKTL